MYHLFAAVVFQQRTSFAVPTSTPSPSSAIAAACGPGRPADRDESSPAWSRTQTWDTSSQVATASWCSELESRTSHRRPTAVAGPPTRRAECRRTRAAIATRGVGQRAKRQRKRAINRCCAPTSSLSSATTPPDRAIRSHTVWSPDVARIRSSSADATAIVDSASLCVCNHVCISCTAVSQARPH